MAEPAIKTSGLSKSFGGLHAVKDLNLEIPPGEIFGFLGPNGAGKTTTVKLLTGLMAPTRGKAWIHGRDISENPIAVKKTIALVPDEPFVYPKLTGIEFMRLVGGLYEVPLEKQKSKIPELLEMFDLKDRAMEILESYSHGMRQKLVFASVLLHEPRVLFLDEPMVGLDPKSAKMVKEIFRRLAENGVTLFMCTHIMEIAEQLCHRVGIMIDGELIAVGTLDEIKKQSRREGFNLEEAFLTLTGNLEVTARSKRLD
ncbi:MAG: ABC transporter [Elusimicrobia bacterium RIFCSPLOWO2_12_FULL_59_9]|nr:MAG: ABC transporter [Elusimicrobia bacterium RIFCSPLOWO2_12_FULL_59_9]